MSQFTTMKALLIDAPKADFRLAEVAKPTPREGEISVRIKASGVNPLDTKIRAGNAAHAGIRFRPFLALIWLASSSRSAPASPSSTAATKSMA
ncbi:hypothetical protein [Rhizobium sp. R693]|uniref:hypothetical protein n=1 Tax=Rhizobium sp. R693 TaxID=1764276 RepID=UPI0026B0F513